MGASGNLATGLAYRLAFATWPKLTEVDFMDNGATDEQLSQVIVHCQHATRNGTKRPWM